MIEERIVNDGHGYLGDFDYLVVHSTANPGATADNHASLWSRGYEYAVHYVSDWDKALHTVNDDRLCWHCGNGNNVSIGIEICEATNDDDFWKGIHIAAQACAEICNKYDWSPYEHMVTHNWMKDNYGGTTHTDPDPYFDQFGYNFDEFLNLTNEYKIGKKEEPEPLKTWGVHLHGSNGTDAQKWVLTNGGLKAVCNGYMLDVKDGQAQHRQPVRVCESNNTDAQKWTLDMQDHTNDKWAYIRSNLNQDFVLACKGGSKESGTGVVLGKFDGALAQKWGLVYAGAADTYYLCNLGSGMMLDVDGGGK